MKAKSQMVMSHLLKMKYQLTENKDKTGLSFLIPVANTSWA
jgi:hypothetical protein